MTVDNASNIIWLCNELFGNMASTTDPCDGVTMVQDEVDEGEGRDVPQRRLALK